jgi:hypothetical protein
MTMESLMNRIVLSALLCAFLAPLAHGEAPAPQKNILVGAYRQVPVDSPVVQDARNYIQTRLVSVNLGEVTTAYVQVVEGLNVKLICTATEDGQQATWKFIAFQSLDGLWHLGLAEHL